MTFRIQPVFFAGRQWGSPGKPGGQRPAPIDAASHAQTYRRILNGYQVLDPLVYNSAAEAANVSNDAATADALLVGQSELLAIPWAAKALASIDKPVLLYMRDRYISAPLADLAGYLAADGADVLVAIDSEDLRTMVRVLAAHKRLREAVILVVGEGFPPCSQAANPHSPELVTDRFGASVVIRTIEQFYEAVGGVSDQDAQAVVADWHQRASNVTAAASKTIVEAAKTSIVVERSAQESGATAVAVDCRALDETSMERYGVFYSPCVGLTILRDAGIPAACEADICCLLAMMMLQEVSGKATFMGNLPLADPAEGWVHIAHCAATTRMDGLDAQPAPLTLEDYHGRENGVATYAPFREGQVVTFGRVDKNLDYLSLAAGPIVDADLQRTRKGCINSMRVAIPDVRAFIHNCLLGDHHAVVYGDVREEMRMLAERIGLTVLEAGA